MIIISSSRRIPKAVKVIASAIQLDRSLESRTRRSIAVFDLHSVGDLGLHSVVRAQTAGLQSQVLRQEKVRQMTLLK
jgi:hypothetical protein